MTTDAAGFAGPAVTVPPADIPHVPGPRCGPLVLGASLLTICCSVKGGSGTSVVTALLALHPKRDTVLVDLDGDGPAVLGLTPPAGQGLSDWFESDAPAAAVGTLAVDVDRTTQLVARGATAPDAASSRCASSPAGWPRRTRSTSSSTPASATPPACAPTTPARRGSCSSSGRATWRSPAPLPPDGAPTAWCSCTNRGAHSGPTMSSERSACRWSPASSTTRRSPAPSTPGSPSPACRRAAQRLHLAA